MSCHQLRDISVSPHIGVFLNLYEEHLDYYKTLEKYFEAKSHIALFQGSLDFLYVGRDVPPLFGNGKKILVTGHAGFIGSNLVNRLFHDMIQ